MHRNLICIRGHWKKKQYMTLYNALQMDLVLIHPQTPLHTPRHHPDTIQTPSRHHQTPSRHLYTQSISPSPDIAVFMQKESTGRKGNIWELWPDINLCKKFSSTNIWGVSGVCLGVSWWCLRDFGQLSGCMIQNLWQVKMSSEDIQIFFFYQSPPWHKSSFISGCLDPVSGVGVYGCLGL